MEILKGKGIVRGTAEGVALVIKSPFCLWPGEVDLKTGKIREGGTSVADRVLVFPHGKKGITGTWRYMIQLGKHKCKPAAIITLEHLDPTFVQGAILADVPLISNLDKNPLKVIKTGDFVKVDAEKGMVYVRYK